MDNNDSGFIKKIENLLDAKECSGDNLKKMETLREIGLNVFNKSAELGFSNATACALLEQNLEEYRQLTVLEANKLTANYKEIWKELANENFQVSKWKSSLKDPSYYISKCSAIEDENQPSEDDLRRYAENFQKKLKSQNIEKRTQFQPKVDSMKRLSNSVLHKSTTTRLPSITPVLDENPRSKTDFRTGLQELNVQSLQKGRAPPTSTTSSGDAPLFSYGSTKKYLGNRLVNHKFIPPVKQTESNPVQNEITNDEPAEEIDERLKSIDPKMIELIRNEIMDNSTPVAWNDIAGLKYAKTIIQEAIVLPMLRPDIFTGLRRPPRGILLFGPPGTGKTLLGKCIASQSKSTFFSISASSLTSKWVGEGEKMVRALFAVASVHQPAVVFIDEIDSLLCQRSESEHESSRRLKTEFLIQLDGVGTGEEDRILIVGATNRPQELDEAARRRLVKRLYIPLPELEARIQIITNLLKNERHSLSDDELTRVGQMTDGYSGADLRTVCHEASMGPIRSIPFDQMQSIDRNDVRPLNVDDFLTALNRVRASVSPDNLEQYVKWDNTYGSGGMLL